MQMSMEQTILEISLRDKIRNGDVRKKTKITEVIERIAALKLLWAGTCCEDTWSCTLLANIALRVTSLPDCHKVVKINIVTVLDMMVVIIALSSNSSNKSSNRGEVKMVVMVVVVVGIIVVQV
ncbi:hypothetical protein M0802_000259 [Mischocyttarus mexicanus]|nr:hypothetical protein M0802_000259 [Mischocyttarus mexicanus]